MVRAQNHCLYLVKDQNFAHSQRERLEKTGRKSPHVLNDDSERKCASQMHR